MEATVSVPFRGSRSEIMLMHASKLFGAGIVSVPFRGSRSEMCISWHVLVLLRQEFPSPFGVHVLKFNVRLSERELALLVSVPFRGSRSEISS